MTSVQVMPRRPTARPLNTDVAAKLSPLTTPTWPFALSRSSAGTSSVTVVDSAMPRALSTTAPASTVRLSAQNAGDAMSVNADFGRTRKSTSAAAKATAVTSWAPTMMRFLRQRSISPPNGTPSTASISMYDPPRNAVASTLRVSR